MGALDFAFYRANVPSIELNPLFIGNGILLCRNLHELMAIMIQKGKKSLSSRWWEIEKSIDTVECQNPVGRPDLIARERIFRQHSHEGMDELGIDRSNDRLLPCDFHKSFVIGTAFEDALFDCELEPQAVPACRLRFLLL